MAETNWSSVVLLLHCNGADTSTTFTDSSASARTFTAAGNAQIKTAQSKFGGASGYFDGTGDYIDTPASADFNGATDFTVECWVRPGVAIPAETAIIVGVANSGGGDGTLSLNQNQTTGYWQATFQDSTQAYRSAISTVAAVANTWTHLAAVKSGQTGYLFVDGTLAATVDITTPTLYYNTKKLAVGRYGEYNGRYFTGYIDDLRFTKVARYTSSFSTPTNEYPNGNSVDPDIGAITVSGLAPTLVRSDIQAGLGALTIDGLAPTLARSEVNASAGALSITGLVPTTYVSDYVYGIASAASPLGAFLGVAVFDFTPFVTVTTMFYVMDLVTPSGTFRVPISSWQATLQTGLSNYFQCVVPAATDWTTEINAATEVVISRQAVDTAGTLQFEYEMVRGPAETIRYDRGPYRNTCTISGYSDGFTADTNPPTTTDRTLADIRSVSTTESGYRVRCGIDWMLRPAQRAYVDGDPFVVEYINYYVLANDSYMDAGGA